jgi:hypothetical protein
VCGHSLVDDGQPEPGAGHRPCRRGPVEAFEDARQVLVGDAWPTVFDLQFRMEPAAEVPGTEPNVHRRPGR